MTSLCGGLQVLELGAGSSASSFAGMVMADAGARVLKLEPPEGDRLRRALPSAFFVWNRGKESLVADLRSADGQERAHSLARHADVVIDAFAPGRSERWGIGADALRAANPALVHCKITGFGPRGRYARIPGYEALVAAKTGLFARGAFAHRAGPLLYPVPWGGFGAAMQAIAGILAALHVREATGRGQALDATLVAGLDPLDYFATTVLQLAAKRAGSTPANPSGVSGASRYGVLVTTRDGRFIQTSTLLPHQGRALTRAAGLDAILSDPANAKMPMFETLEDAQRWEDQLAAAFREQDLAHWLPILEASPDIAFEISRTSEEGLDHPQIRHNGDAIEVADPVHGAIRQVGPIGHFFATPCRIARSAPALGANAGPFTPRAAVAATNGPAPAHPLAGVTIVEFGCFYAMPFALTTLASLGARVIKLEDRAGDPYRQAFGPEVASHKTTSGKESLSLDLRNPRAQALAQRVIDRTDAFVTSFRSGVAERLGLGYDVLGARNPRLVYVHASGYGSSGPYAHRALYAQAAQAVAGSFGRQVGYWSAPEQNRELSLLELSAFIQPRLQQVVDGDSNSALALLAALSLGLYHQRVSGRGQFVSTSMIAGNAWAYSDDFCRYANKPAVPLCDSDCLGLGALYRVYPAREGWICLAVTTEREWRALVAVLGSAGLARDRRFATPASRREHDAALAGILAKHFAERPAAEWEDELLEAGVGCVEANLAGQPVFTSRDSVMRETGLSLEIDHPLFGALVRAAPPVAFSEMSGRVAPICLRGEHNRTILGELGCSTAEISELERDGVVFPPDATAARAMR